jgi:hypothetical protein
VTTLTGEMDQVIQIVGALLILAGFAAAQFGWLRLDSRTYLLLNLIGSAVLTYLAWHERQWGFLLLEAVWAAVSLWSLVRVVRGLPVAGAH